MELDRRILIDGQHCFGPNRAQAGKRNPGPGPGCGLGAGERRRERHALLLLLGRTRGQAFGPSRLQAGRITAAAGRARMNSK